MTTADASHDDGSGYRDLDVEVSRRNKRPREHDNDTRNDALRSVQHEYVAHTHHADGNNADDGSTAAADVRCMPCTFHDALGPYEQPDEAADLEELGGGSGGYVEYEDLPPARRTALQHAVRTLATRLSDAQTPAQREAQCARVARLPGLASTARKAELTAAYRDLVRSGALPASALLEDVLVRKRGKSHSGVLVVTVFMGPGVFSCPKDCYYCPAQPGVARSYLLKEPAVRRGYRNGWDPIRQFHDRATTLERNGHVVDKIELIILGGTFSFYPVDYVEAFMTASFYAANTYYDAAPLRAMGGLLDEQRANETARCRVIGVTIETRPDYITARELRRLRHLGVTRVQLGIQHIDDDILDYIHRECPTAKAVAAVARLLDAGFKVDAHWMPDLPGSSYARDLAMFTYLLSPDNDTLQVDQWKVYPTATVPYTRIAEWYRAGTYKPYAEVDGGAQMVSLLLYILEHCPYRIRLNRIVRDIPTTYIMGGERRCNLRQVLAQEMRTRGVRCRDVRERECKGNAVDVAQTRLYVDEFRASEGTEVYLSIENDTRTQLYGHLRLRLRDDAMDTARNILPVLRGCALVRELHTYGKLIAVDQSNTGSEAQHAGLGTRLMAEAERLARERGYGKVAVIAGVGVRRYYAKLGYALQDTYMVKTLDADTQGDDGSVTVKDDTATATAAAETDDNGSSGGGGGVLATLKRLFRLA